MIDPALVRDLYHDPWAVIIQGEPDQVKWICEGKFMAGILVSGMNVENSPLVYEAKQWDGQTLPHMGWVVVARNRTKDTVGA